MRSSHSLLRPLTEREREILAFLLSLQFSGVHELREQAAVALVSEETDCCPTVELMVDETRAARSSAHSWSPLVEASSARTREPDGAFTLLLFLRDGWLWCLELVHYDGAPSEFPPPEDFGPPVLSDYGAPPLLPE